MAIDPRLSKVGKGKCFVADQRDGLHMQLSRRLESLDLCIASSSRRCHHFLSGRFFKRTSTKWTFEIMFPQAIDISLLQVIAHQPCDAVDGDKFIRWASEMVVLVLAPNLVTGCQQNKKQTVSAVLSATLLSA